MVSTCWHIHSARKSDSVIVSRLAARARSVSNPYPRAGFACARASRSVMSALSGADHSKRPRVAPSTSPPKSAAFVPFMCSIADDRNCLKTMLSGSPALLKQTVRPLGLAFVEVTAAAQVSQSRCSRTSSNITRSLASPRPARLVGAPTLYDRPPVKTSFLPPLRRAIVSISLAKAACCSCSAMTASHTSSAFSIDSDVPKTARTCNTFKKNEAITLLRLVLPFCLDIKNSTVLNLKTHTLDRSPLISSACISAHSCQG